MKGDMIDVSVVVPFYNRSIFLRRLLDSIKSQSLSPKIIYIVDNGSSFEEASNAWLELKSHTLFHRCCYVSSLNKGNANYARNLGYTLSDTKYVAYLDSDDWWEPSHLEESIKILEGSSCLACYSGAFIHNKINVTVNKSVDVKKFLTPFAFLYSKPEGLAQSSSFLINKLKLKNIIAWDNSLKRHQDSDYFINIELKTSGWCYKSTPSSNIDWCEGGSGRDADYASMIAFYEKWRSQIDTHTKKKYLLRQISSCTINRSGQQFKGWYKKEYQEVCKKSYFSMLISSDLVVMLWTMILKSPRMHAIKRIIHLVLG